MKSLLLMPAVVLLVAMSGAALCRIAGWSIHQRELIAAAVIMSAAGIGGMAPIFFIRKGSAEVMAQAGLAGTVIQMLMALGLGLLVLVANWVSATRPFAFWMLAQYWATLAILVAAIVLAVKTSGPSPRESTKQ